MKAKCPHCSTEFHAKRSIGIRTLNVAIIATSLMIMFFMGFSIALLVQLTSKEESKPIASAWENDLQDRENKLARKKHLLAQKEGLLADKERILRSLITKSESKKIEASEKKLEPSFKIVGAFGLKLEEKISVDKVLRYSKMKNKELILYVSAPQKFRSFNRYFVLANPARTIYSIGAQKDFKSRDEAENEFNVIQQVLEQKYQKHFRRMLLYADGVGCYYRDGDYEITLVTKRDLNKTTLELKYTNTKLDEQNTKWRLAIQAEGSDESAI